MSNKPKLYYNESSPAVRGTLLTIAALGLDVELVYLDLLKQEHLKPEFIKKNPLHTVPTLEDGDFVVWDSHVVNSYLVQKYGKFGYEHLYPKDLQKRTIIDQRNAFDLGVLFPRLIAVVRPIITRNAKKIDKEAADRLVEAYTQLEQLFGSNNYVAGTQLSIADFSIIATISSANLLVPIASNRFPRISEWTLRMQRLPYYAEANQVGLEKSAKYVKSLLQ